MKGELKCVLMMPGVLSALIIGITKMDKSFVINLGCNLVVSID